MAKEQDQEFVEYVVKSLVDNPNKVETTRIIDERGVLIELKVDPSDMGKIIGKSGQTAKSLRTLLRVVGAKNNARINLKIAEPEGSDKDFGGEVKAEVKDEVKDEAKDEVKDEAKSAIDDIKI